MDTISHFIKLGRFYSVSSLAREYSVPIHYTDNIRTAEFLEFVRNLEPDILISVACPKIFPESILDIPRLGCINVHCSLLPKGRGLDPGFWPLALGHTETGITIHYMDDKIDNGDIISQKTIPIHPNDSVESLYRRIARVSTNLIVNSLDEIEKGTAVRFPNRKDEATYYGIPTKNDIQQLNKLGKRLIRFADCVPK